MLSPVTTHSPRVTRERGITNHGFANSSRAPLLGPKQAQRTGTTFSSVVNLCATAMGAGVLSLPQAMARCGVFLGTTLVLSFALLADISLLLLIDCSRLSGRRSLQGVGTHFFGNKGKYTVKVSLILFLFGGIILMMLVISDLITSALVDLTSQPIGAVWYTNKDVLTAISVAVIFPTTLCKDISALKYTSGLALAFLAYVIVILAVRFFGDGNDGHIAETVVVVADDPLLIAVALPLFITAFACQFNIFKIEFELKPTSSITNVVHIAVLLVIAPIYLCGGLFGYLRFGSDVNADLLKDARFQGDELITVARLAIGLTNMFKIPLLVLPLRSTVNELFQSNKEASQAQSLDGGDDADSKGRGSMWKPAGQSALLLGTCYGACVGLGSIAKELDLLGSTAGALICLILPGALFVKAFPSSEYVPQHLGLKRAFAWFMLVTGLVLGAATFVITLVTWNSE